MFKCVKYEVVVGVGGNVGQGVDSGVGYGVYIGYIITFAIDDENKMGFYVGSFDVSNYVKYLGYLLYEELELNDGNLLDLSDIFIDDNSGVRKSVGKSIW